MNRRLIDTPTAPFFSAPLRYRNRTAFFPDGRYKTNFLINPGYGDPQSLRPRGPRLSFAAVASVQ